jgi:Na+-transporting NADH:ubiquinone oxidoreductase subunit NqrF
LDEDIFIDMKGVFSMPPVVKIYRSGRLISTADAVLGETIYERIIAENIYIEAPCGGKGRCGKCLVQLSPDGEKVHACQTHINGDMEIYLPDEMKMKIAGPIQRARWLLIPVLSAWQSTSVPRRSSRI